MGRGAASKATVQASQARMNATWGRVRTWLVDHTPEVESVTGEVTMGGMSVSQTYEPGEGMSTGIAASVAPGAQIGNQGINYSIGGTEKLAEAKIEVCIKPRGSKTDKHSAKVTASAGIAGVGTNGSNLCMTLKTPGLPQAEVFFPSGY